MLLFENRAYSYSGLGIKQNNFSWAVHPGSCNSQTPLYPELPEQEPQPAPAGDTTRTAHLWLPPMNQQCPAATCPSIAHSKSSDPACTAVAVATYTQNRPCIPVLIPEPWNLSAHLPLPRIGFRSRASSGVGQCQRCMTLHGTSWGSRGPRITTLMIPHATCLLVFPLFSGCCTEHGAIGSGTATIFALSNEESTPAEQAAAIKRPNDQNFQFRCLSLH